MSLRILQKCVVLASRNNIFAAVSSNFSTRVCLRANNVTLDYMQFAVFQHMPKRFFCAALKNVPREKKEIVGDTNTNKTSPLRLNRISLRRSEPITKEEKFKQNVRTVKALSTAETYDLERLRVGLLEEELYIPHSLSVSSVSLPDVIHAVAKYEIEGESREIFFFRDGVIVFWNIHDIECANVLNFIKPYEQYPHVIDLIKAESEVMSYAHSIEGKSSGLSGDIFVLGEESTTLQKYTFSNAMVLSVKLGISEANLENYINSIEFVTHDLRAGKKLKLTQQDVLKKQGELFSLRHEINLSSDLLDTPDCYWERDDLENLYHRTCNYFNIAKRTKVINEKLNHCVELVGLLSTHLSDRHHVRLEWMIIILIMVEVAFEMIHYVDRFLA